MAHLQHISIVPAPRKDVFEFFEGYNHIGKLVPPDFSLKLIRAPKRMRDGAEFQFHLGRLGLVKEMPWVIRVENFQRYDGFTEKMLMGMFASWRNTYRFEDHSEKHTRVTNTIEYSMPFGIFGRLFDDLIVRRDLKRLLVYGHEALAREMKSRTES